MKIVSRNEGLIAGKDPTGYKIRKADAALFSNIVQPPPCTDALPPPSILSASAVARDNDGGNRLVSTIAGVDH